MIIEDTYTETSEKYHRGFAVDDYNGVISLVSAETGQDGKTYMQWIYPQRRVDGQRVPAEKTAPLKIELGDQHEAIKRLETIVAFLRAKAGVEPKQEYGPIGNDDDAPF